MRQINTELAESLHQFIEGDKPVSTATVTINEGRLFLFLVATMPEARRKGYGEAVVRHALQTAHETTGIRRTVLQRHRSRITALFAARIPSDREVHGMHAGFFLWNIVLRRHWPTGAAELI